MTRHQSSKIKARAALAALLSLAVFGFCVAGLYAAERSRAEQREDQTRQSRQEQQRIENHLEAITPDGTADQWEKTQKALHQLLDGDGTIRAAVVVGRDNRIHAGLPARADLIGRSVGPRAEASPSQSDPVRRPEPRSSSEERMRNRVQDVLTDTPGIGWVADPSFIVRHALTDAKGDHVGWLFALLPPENRRGEPPDLAPLLGITALVSFTLYWFMLPLWVYLDARPRTNKAIPLTLFVFITNFLGWLTYLVIRPESDRLCPACDVAMEPGFRICPMCGWSGALRCHQCGRPARPDWRFCPHCEAARPEADLGAELSRFTR